MDSTKQLKAWAKMIAAISAISFVLGATAALVANRYTGHREVIAPAFTNKGPGIAAAVSGQHLQYLLLFVRGGRELHRRSPATGVHAILRSMLGTSLPAASAIYFGPAQPL
jgi:hypothetical protein